MRSEKDIFRGPRAGCLNSGHKSRQARAVSPPAGTFAYLRPQPALLGCEREVPAHVMEACPPGSPLESPQRDRGSNERVVGHLYSSDRWTRPFDLILGAVATIALLPLIAFLAAMVRLDSRGPAFFRQERVGRDGVPFRMWKFRSMFHNSDDQRHRAAASAWFAAQPKGGAYKTLADPRITRVGRFLRRTSLDEVPQLFNVLAGEMSLVGPRPGIAYELEHYLPWYFERQRVKPGMTGLWQVSGRERVSAEAMMTLDVRYVRERTPWFDLKILILTPPALLGRYPMAR
jgi:lipopolysaccharide/colanic/teichoic acid biosynthesis glycosyltransferase